MGLHLTGKGSIWDALGNAAGDVGSAVGGAASGLYHGVVNTVTGDIIEPTRSLVAEATGNQAAQAAADQRASADQAGSLPYQTVEQVANLGGAGYNLLFKDPVQSLMGDQQASDNSFKAGMHELNKTIPGAIIAPVERGLANVGAKNNPQGPDTKTIQQEIGIDPNVSVGHQLANSGVNAALLALPGHTGEVTDAVKGGLDTAAETARNVADSTTPLNEVGAIGKDVSSDVPKGRPPAESLPPVVDPEAAIHDANPLKPAEPTTTPEPTPEPSAAEMLASQRAAEQIDNPGPQIDYNQVEGAGKRLQSAINDRAQTLKGIEDQARGGDKQQTFDEKGNADGYVRTSSHSKFYRDTFAETGRKPTVAMYREEAERQLRSGTDEESANYHNLTRHAKVEQDLAEHNAADKASGYSKVKTKAPAGMGKNKMTAAQLEKFQSPEYATRLEAWQKVESARAALKDADQQIKSMDKIRAKINNPEKLMEHSQASMSARMKRNLLQNIVRQHSDAYNAADQALEERYGNTILRKPGTRKTVTVGGEKAGGTFKIGDDGKVALAETAGRSVSGKATPEDAPYNLADVLGHEPGGAPYSGPNLNEGAFDPAEMDRLFREDHPSASGLPKRELAGDEAAFNALESGGGMDDALKAYQDATGADEAAARKAINYVAEEGQLPETEALLKRNPSYGTFDRPEPRNLEDVDNEVKTYSRTISYLQDQVHKAYDMLDEHDQTLLEHSRGLNPQELIAKAHDQSVFETAISAMDQAGNDMHEIGRINGSDAVYRENRRAGLHTEGEPDPEAEPMAPFKDELSRSEGRAQARHYNNYEEIPKEAGRVRQHGNIIEDFDHDVRQAMSYAHDRAIQRGVNAVHGGDATLYGAPDSVHSKQLNGANNVFTSPEIAKEWSKLHPEQKARAWYMKPYDAATSAIVQAVVVNPGIHGSNQLAQAFEAAGKTSHIGLDGGAELAKNIAHRVTPEEAYQFYKEGNHSPSYKGADQGFVSRITHGVTDVNKNAMAAIELKLRMSLWKTLRDGGLDATEARDAINTYMGSEKAMGAAASNFGFFWHYFKTTTGSIVKTVAHPVENSGVIVNAAVAAATVYAMNQGWKAMTGNQNAYVHTPGNLGTIKDIYNTGRDLYNKHYLQATGIITNRINPVIREGVSQAFNTDLTYGNPIAPNGTAAERLTHAAGLTPETSVIGNEMNGKKSLAESGENFLGAYTPHAKGYEASSKIPALNTQPVDANGKPIPLKSGNGLAQQSAYYDSVEQARNSLPAGERAVYDRLTAGERDANGNSIGKNDKQAQAHYADLYSHPDVLEAIAKQKQALAAKTGTQVDPLYSSDLTPAQRSEYAHIQSLPYKGDDYIQQTVDPATGKQDSWLKDLTTARADWYKTQDFAGAPPSEQVTPPTFDAQTEADMNTASTLSGTEKVQFIDAHPNLQNAYDAIAKYTNDRRVAQGNAPFKLFPKADPETQANINTYMGLDKAGRSGWIKANPDAYAKMQDYFSATSEYELANSAGQDKYQGATPSQTELKSAYNLGNYDIAKDPTTGKFAIDPSSANTASAAAYAKSSASNKSASFDRTVRNAYNYSKKQKGIRVRTIGQNRAANPRKTRSKMVRVARGPSTGKLRVKSASIA